MRGRLHLHLEISSKRTDMHVVAARESPLCWRMLLCFLLRGGTSTLTHESLARAARVAVITVAAPSDRITGADT